MGYERDAIARMNGYEPGKQPQSREIIKLNTNENPFTPCQGVMAALHQIEADSLRRYPSPMADAFREIAAKVHHITPDNIVAVNGGDELLRLMLTTFVDPGKPIGIIDPSYSLYPVLAEIHGSPVVRVEANPNWSIPSNLARTMNQASVQVTFVVNPHAPSGCLASVDTIAALASELSGVLLVDEAYVDFVDPEMHHDLTMLVNRFDNLILLRTLSKGYSLAGLRFGYGLGAQSLIQPIRTKTADSYPTDAVAQTLAYAALEHRNEAAKTWQLVREERTTLCQALCDLGFSVPTSQSNFLLCGVGADATRAKSIQETLEKRGFFVRYFDHPRLCDKLRISLGTPEQNQRLLKELREIVKG